jgi:GAF domain-containing protein
MKVAVAGAEPGSVPRGASFCNRTIQGEGPLIVEDATRDPHFSTLNAVTAAGPVRFYAGHPLESVDGYRIGTICVYDPAARDPGTVNGALLRDLALLVQAEMTGRDVAPRQPGAIRAAAA